MKWYALRERAGSRNWEHCRAACLACRQPVARAQWRPEAIGLRALYANSVMVCRTNFSSTRDLFAAEVRYSWIWPSDFFKH